MKKVLVVDDERMIRSLIKMLLKDLPLEVWEAEDGAQALDLSAHERFDLVISDYRMPRLDGKKLLEKCRQEFPHLPFILISGFCPERPDGRDHVFFLAKPFEVEDFVDLVRGVLQVN